ncbi:MAG: MASE3 domain-containing protein [Bacillota bacterium]|nr:MASE3 domain-containing protein [Bacillota bacterium]
MPGELDAATVPRQVVLTHNIQRIIIHGFGAVMSIGLLVLAWRFNSSLSRASFLEFHSVIEMTTVVVSMCVFIVALYHYEQTNHLQDLTLSMTFLIVGLLYFAHTLSYPGMAKFITPNSIQKAFAFCALARFVEALGLFAYALMKREYSRRLPILGVVAGTWFFGMGLTLFIAYYSHLLPALYLEGEGATMAKIITEGIILVISLAAMFLVFRAGTSETEDYLLATLGFFVFVEVYFGVITAPEDAFSILGHLFKLASFGCIFWLLFVSSIRKLYLANEQLSYANAQLARSNRLKSEILANTSHELRTPLTAVIAFTELVQDPSTGPLNDLQRDYLNEISDSAKSLLRQINNLLHLSKIESGQTMLSRETVNLEALIDETLRGIRGLFQKQHLNVQTEIAPPGLTAYVDRDKLKQVLNNLLVNAVKFTPAGGTITVSVSVTGQPPNSVAIAVRDTGIGIAPEHQKKVFSKFYQVENAPCRLFQGSGLGLTVAKHLVEMHGGQIFLQSTPGAGSTFTVALPLARPGADEETTDS